MLKMALRQAVELGSFERAADNFSELTGVAISASSLKRLVLTYGRRWRRQTSRKRLRGGGNRRRTVRCWWYRLMG